MVRVPVRTPSPLRPPRRGIAGYLIVALAALALGAAGTHVALRDRATPSQPTTTTGQGPAGQTMPGSTKSDGASTARPAGVGDKAVQITPQRQQLIGVRTATVEHRALDTTVRTVGTLAYDETRVTQVHTKIAGWVERLFVDYVGKNVKRGEPLFTVYSPDLVATQKEYLLALTGAEQLEPASSPKHGRAPSRSSPRPASG